MKHYQTLHVPEEIRYISEWKDLKLPQTKIILNKKICGCGFTNYFLTNDEPIVLISPRLELINSKMNTPELQGKIFYFRKSTEQKLEDYLLLASTPKILVTYDSLPMLYKHIKGKRINFRFVLDEWQCLITDSHLKGNVELSLLNTIFQNETNILLLSATPIKDEFLEMILELRAFEIIELEWNEKRLRKVNIAFKPIRRSVNEEASEIIKHYRQKGYFASKIVNGKEYQSKEALFFLNNLTLILQIIKANKLSPDETLVVCGSDERNANRLSQIGMKSGQHLNSKAEQHRNKPFTFITRTAFQGADIYSNNATTFIFSNPNFESLTLDISIDLPQIVGRIRNLDNPFRDEVTFFYKTFKDDEESFRQYIEEKTKKSLEALADYKNTPINALIGGHIQRNQRNEKFKDNFLDYDGKNLVINELVRTSELITYDIYKNRTKTVFSIIEDLKENGFECSTYIHTENKQLEQFINEFYRDSNFQRRMKYFCDYLEENPSQIEVIHACKEIPFIYKEIYDYLGRDIMKALSYKECDLTSEVIFKKKRKLLYERFRQIFQSGKRYLKTDIKRIIIEEYKKLNINKKVSATILKEFGFQLRETKINHKNAFQLL